MTAAKAALAAFNVSSVTAAVGSLSGLLGPAGLAAAAGAAIVAFTSLSSSTQSADDIFRKHQATIDDYKAKMGQATDAVKTFSEEQEEAYRKSLERQRDILNTDIADAVKGVNGSLADVSIFGAGIAKAPLIQEAKEAVEELGRELAKLGQNVTQDDLNAYAEKVWAIDERIRAAHLDTKEWNDAITKLVGEGDSFVLSLAAMIAKSLDLEGTLERLRQTTANTKGELATGWTLDVDNVTKGISTMEKSIRGMKAEMLGFKSSKALVELLPELSPEEIKAAKDAYGKEGLAGALQSVGDATKAWGFEQRNAFDDLLRTSNALDAQEKKRDAWRKSQQQASKSAEAAARRASVSAVNLNELRKSVEALEAANIPAAKSFDQMADKIREQSKQAVIAIDADAKRLVISKKLTAAQAEEWKGLKYRENEAKTTQKLAEIEAKRAEQDKKYADIRLDFEKRYADMVGLSSDAVSKSISKQADEYRKAIEAGENAAEELVRLEEWKRDQIQRASREAMDGAAVALRDYQAEATNQAKAMNETFSGLFSGMDSGFRGVWQQMLEDGKVSLSSLKSLFSSFLADLIHIAITRPIVVQIAGVVSGMLGTGGVAGAAAGAGASGSGGVNVGGVSGLIPNSWTSGIADTINNTMAGWFPTTFSPVGVAGIVMTPVTGSAQIAGLKAAEAGLTGANAGGGLANGTFLQTASPYFMAAGLGGLGYSTIGSALGLPQSKYSGLTASLGAAGGWGLGSLAAGSAAMAGSGMAAGATFGSVIPVVGTIIGALAGGALGSLFGQQRKTHPSVYGHMEGLGYTKDTQTYVDAFMNQATYDRAGKADAEPYAQVIGEAASQTAAQILDLAALLPEEYRKKVETQLASVTWDAGRGISGAEWNLQSWDGKAEEDIQAAVNDMFTQMGYGANKAFSEAGIGGLFDSFDLSTEEGFKKAQTAISAISSITTAIDEIKSPTTEAEAQAKSFVEQMDALAESVKANGLNAEYADKLFGEYRSAYLDNYIESLEKMFSPLSQIEHQAKSYKESIDGYVAALTTMGASEEQLAKVRGYSQTAIDSITGSLDAAFFPLSDVEQQTKSTMESLTAYENALKSLDATAEELAKVDAARGKVQSDLLSQVNAYIETTPEIVTSTRDTMSALDGLKASMVEAGNSAEDLAQVDVARAKVQADFLDKARAYVSTTPEIVTQSSAMNAEFDVLRQAMIEAGNATADLTELEQTRVQAVAAMQAQYAESFRQTYAQRYASLTGDTNGLANLQQQASFASELAEIEKTWGKTSIQYRQMQALQDAEAAKLRLEQAQAQAAKAKIDADLKYLQDELAALERQRDQQIIQSSIDGIKAQQDASSALIKELEDQKSAAEKLSDTWKGVLDSVADARLGMYQSDSNPDLFSRLYTAQDEFDKLYNQAKAGDADAAKEMSSMASTLLDLNMQTSASTSDYLDAFYGVDKKLKEVSAYADTQVSDAQKQLTALQAQLEAENAQYSLLVSQLTTQQEALSALNGQTQTLASIQKQIANLKTEINITIQGQASSSTTVDNAQGDYDDAKDKVDQTKPLVGIYGSNYLTEYDLLIAKVASLNRGEYVEPAYGIPAGGWTVANTRKAMLDWYGSIKGWYDDAGKREGFYRGGLTPVDEMFSVGEQGKEYMLSPSQYVVLNNSMTRKLDEMQYLSRQTRHPVMDYQLIQMPAAGTDRDATAELVKLREEVAELKNILRQTLTLTDTVAANNGKQYRMMQKWDSDGLPATRAN